MSLSDFAHRLRAADARSMLVQLDLGCSPSSF
jgi:hypothetical protein